MDAVAVEPLVERDYATEMEAFISEHEPSGDVVLAIFAIDLVEKLQNEDPELLLGWLMVHAPDLMHEWVRAKWRKSRNRIQTRRHEAHVAMTTNGDMSIFLHHRFVVDDKNTHRLLGDMTGADHLFVAKGYERDSKAAKMRAALHRAAARAVGDKRTSEVLTVEQWESLCAKYL